MDVSHVLEMSNEEQHLLDVSWPYQKIRVKYGKMEQNKNKIKSWTAKEFTPDHFSNINRSLS